MGQFSIYLEKILNEESIYNKNINLYNKGLLKLPNNLPTEIGGDFNCTKNKLTSLKGAPRKIGGDFECALNHLTSLDGAPKEVGGSFECKNNQIISLKGAPK
jgi:hypothetical protein